MRLYPAESVNSDTEIGGFVCVFPSGATKQVAWKSQAPIQDTLAAAKQYTASLIDHLVKQGLNDDVGRTNWASCVAAIQKVISDWNEQRRKVLHGVQHAALVQ
jgi:hypothetical protein